MIRFINVTYIKERTTIESNVDDKKIAPFIMKVQETHLQMALGSTFYLYILDNFNTGNLTPEENILVEEFIKPMVSEWTYYEAYPHISIKTTNKSVSRERSEYSEAVNINDVKWMRSSIRDMAEFYTKRLIKWLTDNHVDFPLYFNPDPKENVRKNKQAYFSGIHIAGKGRRPGSHNERLGRFGGFCDDWDC